MASMNAILAMMMTSGAAVALALLLRLAGLRRSAVVGGVVAGALLGSTVLGRAAPDFYARYFTGGASQHEAIEHLRSRQGADLAALRATGVSDAAIDEWRETQHKQMQAAIEALETAEAAHQQPRIMLMAVLALLLLVAALPRSRWPESVSESAFAALWTALITCGVVGLAVIFIFNGTRAQAIALGLSFAVVGTNVVLPRRDGEERHEPVVMIPNEIRERLVDVAFLLWFICFVAVVVAVVGAVQSGGALTGGFKIVLPVAVVLGVTVRLLPLRVRYGLRMVVLPAILTALLMLNVDLLSWTVVAPLVLAAIVGGDARWLGLASAMRWQGWPWRNAWMGTMPLVDAAPVQVAIAGAFFVSGWLSGPLLACAVFGAAIIDITQPLRPRLLTMLTQQPDDQSSR